MAWKGLPVEANARRELLAKLRDAGVQFIAEITTGGSYVPKPSLKPEDHLDDFCASGGSRECARFLSPPSRDAMRGRSHRAWIFSGAP